jgi:CxxC motif-containing protein (DUF1111 family)
MLKIRSRVWLTALACCGLIAGCASDADELDLQLSSEQQAITALGDPLPGISAEDFALAAEAFAAEEAIEDGVGPIFNEVGCGNCHFQGALGGAGTQIERRFGTFVNGRFEPLANDGLGPLPARGGSLRQLFTVGRFTALNGRACNVPLEVEPREATVRNVGRATTPLFGLGLVDALPDSVFDAIAASQPASIRGFVNRVRILLPNLDDPAQRVGGTRVGRFGWKAGVSTLSEFSADAYVNEMGITTQHCVNGASITTFATEAAPNGIPVPPGCDDLAPPAPAGVPPQTDEFVGACAPGQSELQDDVNEFFEFMTFLAPPPRAIVDPLATARGQTQFSRAGCIGCHVASFRTPSSPANGVPGNLVFSPFSDFLVHDMDGASDFIGNLGDPVAVTRRMRTAPLWGNRFRTQFMHDGRATSITGAIREHRGQGQASNTFFFNNMTSQQRSDLITFVRSL